MQLKWNLLHRFILLHIADIAIKTISKQIRRIRIPSIEIIFQSHNIFGFNRGHSLINMNYDRAVKLKRSTFNIMTPKKTRGILHQTIECNNNSFVLFIHVQGNWSRCNNKTSIKEFSIKTITPIDISCNNRKS